MDSKEDKIPSIIPGLAIIFILAFLILSGFYSGTSTVPIRHYNTSGIINNPIKIWHGTVVPSSAIDNTINISSAGFNTILSCSYEAISTDEYPLWVKCTNMTTTQITYNIFQPNTSLVNILGNLVLLGDSYVPATNLSGISIRVTVMGY